MSGMTDMADWLFGPFEEHCDKLALDVSGAKELATSEGRTYCGLTEEDIFLTRSIITPKHKPPKPQSFNDQAYGVMRGDGWESDGKVIEVRFGG